MVATRTGKTGMYLNVKFVYLMVLQNLKNLFFSSTVLAVGLLNLVFDYGG